MNQGEDFFVALLRTLGPGAGRAIILQQIEKMDSLSLLRLMRESKTMRRIIGVKGDVWEPRLYRLLNAIFGRRATLAFWAFDGVETSFPTISKSASLPHLACHVTNQRFGHRVAQRNPESHNAPQ